MNSSCQRKSHRGQANVSKSNFAVFRFRSTALQVNDNAFFKTGYFPRVSSGYDNASVSNVGVLRDFPLQPSRYSTITLVWCEILCITESDLKTLMAPKF